ncbi:MAG TPA: nucleotidyltransferase family protein [Clostridia bacterium]|nr:nucleotidyltransferase family protein [Clostridia bacterium]
MLFFIMKLLIIIAEYNPFHQGHKYHLSKAKKETGASHSLVLMGGNFLQRGDVAIEDKFIRAKKALDGGADLVAELPFVYASSWAREFAQGGVAIANKIPLPATLSFGSETGSISQLKNLLAKIDQIEKDKEHSYGDLVRKNLICPPKGANDILGLEYLRALKDTKSIHKAHTVLRLGQAYHDDKQSTFPSASSLRRQIKEGEIPHDNPLFLEDFSDYIYSALLTKDLLPTYGMIEGLENRLLKELGPNISLEEYIDRLSTKRYRPARLRRLLIHHLIGYTKLDHKKLKDVAYLRPLAYTKKGTQILSMVKNTPLKIILPHERQGDPLISRSLELDLLASRVYNFKAGLSPGDFKRNLLHR